ADDRPTLPQLRAVLAQLVEPARPSSVPPAEPESSAPFVMPSPPRPATVTPPVSRPRTPFLLGAVGVAAVAVLAFVGLRRSAEPPPDSPAPAASEPAPASPPASAPAPAPAPAPDSALVLELDARGRIEVDGAVVAEASAGAHVPLA